MPRLALLVSLIAGAAQSVPSVPVDQGSRLTIERARQILREQGARQAVETSMNDNWGQLLDAIATGESAWLDIAVELAAHSDVEASESLSAAMGEALWRAPQEVLRRLDGKAFSVSGVCGNSFADLAIQGATDAQATVARQEAAVAKVKDPKLKQRRDTCLERIRAQKHG